METTLLFFKKKLTLERPILVNRKPVQVAAKYRYNQKPRDMIRVSKGIVRLPDKFLGFLPLYLGVEMVLGITILNKISGAYGILALFTGHPLELMQWASYLWSIFTLLIVAQGLWEIHHPTLLTFSQILGYYSLDTLLTAFFTLWFTHLWFSVEGTEPSNASEAPDVVNLDEVLKRQSASKAYEYGVTLFITWISFVFRLYFNCILASFVQALLRNPKFMVDRDDLEMNLRGKPVWQRWWVRNKEYCYALCRHYLG